MYQAIIKCAILLLLCYPLTCKSQDSIPLNDIQKHWEHKDFQELILLLEEYKDSKDTWYNGFSYILAQSYYNTGHEKAAFKEFERYLSLSENRVYSGFPWLDGLCHNIIVQDVMLTMAEVLLGKDSCEQALSYLDNAQSIHVIYGSGNLMFSRLERLAYLKGVAFKCRSKNDSALFELLPFAVNYYSGNSRRIIDLALNILISEKDTNKLYDYPYLYLNSFL